MALSRLLQPKSSLQINKYGFPNPVRWLSSQYSDAEVNKTSQLKKTCVTRELRAVAVESFVMKYMETNPGVFPKAIHIQNEVGGSWYTVKAILHNIKEKMLGSPQLENHQNADASTLAKDTAASTVITFHSVPDNGIEPGDHPDSAVHADKVRQAQDKHGNIEHCTSRAKGESSRALTVDKAASEVSTMHNSSSSYELQDPSVVQCTETGSEFLATETDASENVTPHLSGKYNSEGVVQLNAATGSLQQELDCRHMQPKELVSNMCETADKNLVPNSKFFSHFEHDKLNSTGCRDQPDNKTMTCGVSSSSCVEMSTISALPDTSRKVRTLADIFNKFTDDAAVVEAKNEERESEAALPDTLLGFRKERGSQAKGLPSTDILLPSESTNKWQDLRMNKSVSTGFENQRPGKEKIASNLRQNIIANVSESFSGSKNLKLLEDLEGVNSQASEFITNTKRDISVPSFLRHLEEPMQKDEAKRSDIHGLINCLRRLPREPSIASPKQKSSFSRTDESSERSQLGIQSLASLQSSDKKERNVSLNCLAVRRKCEDDGTLNVLPVGMRCQGDETGTPDCTKPSACKQLALVMDKKESKEIGHKLLVKKELDENKAVVKFLLRNTTETHIVDAFQPCGDIMKVEFSSFEGAFYKTANIYFKTREGLRNALEKTDMMVRSANITVDDAAPMKDVSNRITVPSLIGDTSAPATLLKNPTRTVKITQLTHDISSHDVVSALASCGSNATGFFLGALDSVAYVEFETKDGKEMALTKHSIDVLGKQLLIFRIDAPRTTVVRVSHPSIKASKVTQMCNSLGKTSRVNMRHAGIMDVHFKLAEWPNMLKILNRLNGVQIDGHKLLAQPASVFPPEILRILWNQPEEREYVKSEVQNLLQKLGENVVDKVKLTDLAEFYSDK